MAAGGKKLENNSLAGYNVVYKRRWPMKSDGGVDESDEADGWTTDGCITSPQLPFSM